jgi:hypothetical protein
MKVRFLTGGALVLAGIGTFAVTANHRLSQSPAVRVVVPSAEGVALSPSPAIEPTAETPPPTARALSSDKAVPVPAGFAEDVKQSRLAGQVPPLGSPCSKVEPAWMSDPKNAGPKLWPLGSFDGSGNCIVQGWVFNPAAVPPEIQKLQMARIDKNGHSPSAIFDDEGHIIGWTGLPANAPPDLSKSGPGV